MFDMTKSSGMTVAMALLLLAGCGASSAPEPVGAEATAAVEPPESTVRVSLDEIADVAETLPENAGGIDLGELGPEDGLTFCEAFASVPARWVDDAVVPVQFWVDAFTAARDDVPADAAEAVDRLLAFGQWKLDWNFKRVEELSLIHI